MRWKAWSVSNYLCNQLNIIINIIIIMESTSLSSSSDNYKMTNITNSPSATWSACDQLLLREQCRAVKAFLDRCSKTFTWIKAHPLYTYKWEDQKTEIWNAFIWQILFNIWKCITCADVTLRLKYIFLLTSGQLCLMKLEISCLRSWRSSSLTLSHHQWF